MYKSAYGMERVFDYILKLGEEDKKMIYLKLHAMYNNGTNYTGFPHNFTSDLLDLDPTLIRP